MAYPVLTCIIKPHQRGVIATPDLVGEKPFGLESLGVVLTAERQSRFSEKKSSQQVGMRLPRRLRPARHSILRSPANGIFASLRQAAAEDEPPALWAGLRRGGRAPRNDVIIPAICRTRC